MYSQLILSLFQSPYHKGRLADATLTGNAGIQGQGPFMEVYLNHSDNVIVDSGFETYTCPAAVACGSFIAKWSCGKTLDEARMITADDLNIVLGGLPLGKEHLATLAVKALNSALDMANQEVQK